MGEPMLSMGAISRENASLRERLNEALSENADLRREVGRIRHANQEQALRRHYGLTPMEAHFLMTLYSVRHRAITKVALHDVLYHDLADAPFLKIIDVWLCKVRTKLAKHGDRGVIETVWASGLQITPAGAKRLAEVLGETRG